jgi:asparagine synthase (glutamine-hydrolysing)
MGWDVFGRYYFALELKALEGTCNKIDISSGSLFYSWEGELKKWYTRDWMSYDAVKDNKSDMNELLYCP